jgi:Rhodanese-related sulfurtransferase
MALENWQMIRKMKNRYLKIFSLLFLQLACFSFSVCSQSVYVGKTGSQGKILKKYIAPEELTKLVENPNDSIWIIDVRSEKAYANGHIPTARNFPAGSIKSRLSEIPVNKYLILYCTVGANAQIASKTLKKAGYKRYINWGGITRWTGPKEASH